MAQQPMKGTFGNPFQFTGEGGIFQNPQQLNQLTQNPLFMMGMGLLGSRGNPFQAATQGLLGSAKAQVEADERQRLEQQRKQLQEWLQSQGVPAQEAQRQAALQLTPEAALGGDRPGQGAMQPDSLDYLTMERILRGL